ncbi:MAG: ComEC/Rec2 family competence protein [Rhizobiaceae bacterium]
MDDHFGNKGEKFPQGQSAFAGFRLAEPGNGLPVTIRPAGFRVLVLHDLGERLRFSAEWLGHEWQREQALGGTYNLAPACLALGILTYFNAAAEPLLWVVIVTCAVLALLVGQIAVHGILRSLAILLLLFLAGMAAAQMRTIQADHRTVTAWHKGVISGTVIETSHNSRGQPRYLIRPAAIEGYEAAALPPLIRVSARSGSAVLLPGDGISGKAVIQPLTGPAYPGGYDFSFHAWYEQLAGVGYFTELPARAEDLRVTGMRDRFVTAVNRLRVAIAERIAAGMPAQEAALAIALVTGDRSLIAPKVQESLRQSGLAHILAISGLHMALVTLTVAASLRWLLSLFPSIALRHPVRKWAASAGLLAATSYLAISGASVATERAWIMIAIMLGAAILDRRAMTVRNVATAALVILLLEPESLLEPGFQMSFAAVAALVSSYESWTAYRQGRKHQPDILFRRGERWPVAILLLSMRNHLAALMFTSLVAGLATGLFAAYHFHRIAPLGLVSNLLAMPVVSFLVMPLALISSLLMPYGLETLTLPALGSSVSLVVGVSDWTNGFALDGITGARTQQFLVAGTVSLTALSVLRSRLRYFAVLPLILFVLSLGNPAIPNVLVSEDGRAAAYRTGEGRLVLLYPRRNRFVSDIWLRAWSGGVADTDRSGIGECGKDRCIAELPSGESLHLVYAPALLDEACEKADLLVAPRLKWVNCRGRKPSIILKRGDFETGGSQAIYLLAGADPPVTKSAVHAKGKPDPATVNARQPSVVTANALRVVSARSNGNRPWHRVPQVTDQQSGPRSSAPPGKSGSSAKTTLTFDMFSSGGSGRRGVPVSSRDPD